MINTKKFSTAVRFSIKTHEVYQKQKRKGNDIPYITHPLTVGLILARAGADEDTVIAGLLHDTIEDSIPEKKVTFEMLEGRFGKNVADLVLSVSETDKSLSWEERKHAALDHLKTFSREALLVKSADVISNSTELIDDYNRNGEQTFARFNAPKEKILGHALEVVSTILERWPASPLASDLHMIETEVHRMNRATVAARFPARIISFEQYDENTIIVCGSCHWKGKCEEGVEHHYMQT